MSLNPAPIDIYNNENKFEPKSHKKDIKHRVLELFEDKSTSQQSGFERPKPTKKESDVLESDNEAFDEYKPLPISQTQHAIHKQRMPKSNTTTHQTDEDISREQFSTLEQRTPQSLYKAAYSANIPHYTQQSDYNTQQAQLLQRMNYMIHLLEEQQEERTEHVVEELILYSFLGIFTIFMVDSFTRVGKYSR
jgi:hypothetical protein